MRTIVTDVYAFNIAWHTVDFSTLVAGRNYGKSYTVPVPAWLLKTEEGYILVDTGLDPNMITDPVGTWGAALVKAVQPVMTEETHLYSHLKRLGVTPDEVKYVIYTHLHHDHAGGARLFPKALHIVQKREYGWATMPDRFTRGIYLKNDFEYPFLKWFFVDGDVVLFPGIQLLTTPGHTPGHQSIVLWDVPKLGTTILAGDAAYLIDNVRLDQPPSILTNTRDVQDSVHRLTALADAHDAMLIVGHDPVYFDLLEHGPAPLVRLPDETRRYWQEGKSVVYPLGVPPRGDES